MKHQNYNQSYNNCYYYYSFKKSTNMNTNIKHCFMLLLFSIISLPMFAQSNSVERTYYDYNRDWTLGFHGGFSWQQSDIYDKFGGGFGLTLGKRITGQPGSFFATDLRGRLTYSNSFGQDYLLNSDTVTLNNLLTSSNGQDVNSYSNDFLSNYRTDMVDLDIEGVLTANRLRERTGVILQLFGGLGLDFYNAKTDQLDNNGDIYDYQSIDFTNLSNRQIRVAAKDLRQEAFRNGGYETTDGTKLTFMPSWGLGIGYQFAPWFSLGYEHRFAYPVSDMLDSEVGVNTGNTNNDKHHLSYLYARFHFGANGECNPPLIKVLSPTANPLSTQAPSINIEAEIEHLNDRKELTVTVNGLPNYSYNYNTANDKFNLQILLEGGENVIRLQANNSCDEDVAVITVIYSPNIVTGTGPAVTFTQPVTDQYKTTSRNYTFNAQLERVKSKSDIDMTINGNSTNDFTYDAKTGIVTRIVNCVEGANVMSITARNKFGEASETRTVIYDAPVRQELKPTVRITTPAQSPYTTSAVMQQIVANLSNVYAKKDIKFTVNGQNRNFDYNTNKGTLTANINLIDGNNIVVVEGFNTAGSDKDQKTIIYQRQVVVDPVINPPVVNVTAPAANPHNTANNNITIRANVQNVANKSQVTFTLNGQNINSFAYNNGSFVASNVTLVEGANVFNITGTNSAGTAADGGTIVYKKPTPTVQRPVVKITEPTANPYNTSSSIGGVKANIQHIDNKNQITFSVNGQQTNDFTYSNGSLVASRISLVEGANVINITAQNSAGSATDGVTIVYKKMAPVLRPPVVKVTEPLANPYNTANASTTIRATVNFATQNEIEFYLNNQKISNFSFNDAKDEFVATVNLVSGANTFNIKATNNAGTASDGGSIVYKTQPTVIAPTVNITSPSSNALLYTSSSPVTATIKNVTSKNGITFTVNGQAATNFSYNAGTQQFQGTASGFVSGSNVIKITATNTAGTANDAVTILYREATIAPPVITVATPRQNPFATKDAKVQIMATITNIANKSGITFVMNGKNVTDYTFNPMSNTFAYTGNMNEGSNRFTIDAQNDGGRDAYKGEIIYTKTPVVPAPKVTITTPKNNDVVSVPNVSLKANLQNVASKSDVTLTINGAETNSFMYESRTGGLLIGLTLKEGKNVIAIEGRNASGKDSETVNVVYKKPAPAQKPVIRFTNLNNANPFTMLNDISTADGEVLYVNGQSDITVKVNGSTINQWSYNAATKKFSIDYTWVVGTNNIVMTATNADGTTTKTQTIIYNRIIAPTVAFIAPTTDGNRLTVATATADVRAIINNAKENEVTLKVNGKASRFTLNGTTLTAKVTLVDGANTIVLAAQNQGGQATKTITLLYAKPVLPPTISITSGNATVSKPSYTVKATIKNIDDKNSIGVTINGKAVTNFSFNTKTGALTVNTTLQEGNNSIQIAVRNSAGVDMKSATVKYQPIKIDAPSGGSSSNNGEKPKSVSNKSAVKAPVVKKPTVKVPTVKTPVVKKPAVKKPAVKKEEVKKEEVKPTEKKPVEKTEPKRGDGN